jgi:hypothetical protein
MQIGNCRAGISSKFSNQRTYDKAIKRFSDLELEYQELLATSDYLKTQIDEVNAILTMDLQLKLNSHSSLVSSLKEHFSQDFCITALKSPLNEFLKTQYIFSGSEREVRV